MASTKVTFVTGTAEVKRRDPTLPTELHPEQHLTTEPSTPLQVSYVDGKCTCCPYGYHIDLDFLNFCRDLESGSTLKNLKRIQRTKRKLRKSMEIMLDEQEGIAADPNSAPPDVVHSTEAGRLMHMINYERSATNRILNQIDSTVTTTISGMEGGRGRRYMSSDSDEPITPYTPHGASHPLDESNRMTPSFSTSGRTDSLSSLSSVSTVSSEAPMLHQAQYMQQQQQQHYHHSLTSRTTTKVVENPVLEMGTAEMKQYSTTSSAMLADMDEPNYRPQVDRRPKVPAKTPPPRASPDVNQMSLQSVREAMAVSLQRMRELEEQVKTIPILQVRISVLKEEKRLLNLQLKASKSTAKPPMVSIGVGDGRVDVVEKMDMAIHPQRQFELPKSFSPVASSPTQKSPVVKSPPPTLPKPVRTFSIGVGDHSVIEPYNLQPDLPTGYTVCDNEVYTEIHSTTVIEREKMFNRIQAPSLNMSFQQTSHDVRDVRGSMSQAEPHFTINQIQRSTPKALTRTIGVGDGNVFDGSGLHVHEKEFRTVIIGQKDNVAKRNVGIECRVPTRDVGVSFRCDEEKPATRTVGVNVNYDTSGILTSLDFRGETELRMALRGVLQRNVRSVGTNCNFRPATIECGTYTDIQSGVSVGCGDETHRTDVELRPAVTRKAVGLMAKPEISSRYVSTEKDWVLDASTNTYEVDKYHKAVMTDRQKMMFAATNTEATPSRPSSMQTDQKMFMAMDVFKHGSTNTEQTTKLSTGIVTDIIPTFSTGVNTTEKVSDVFRESSQQQQKTMELKSILKKPKGIDKGVGDGIIEDAYSFSETTLVSSTSSQQAASPTTKNMSVQEQIVQRGANQADAFLTSSEYTKKSSKVNDGNNYYSSYEISSRSAPFSTTYKTSQNELLHKSSSQEDLEKRNSAFERVSPTKPEDSFSETVVEHYVITKDGKRLISEEKTTSTSAGSNHTFKSYTDRDQGYLTQQKSTPEESYNSYRSLSENTFGGSGSGGYTETSYSATSGSGGYTGTIASSESGDFTDTGLSTTGRSGSFTDTSLITTGGSGGFTKTSHSSGSGGDGFTETSYSYSSSGGGSGFTETSSGGGGSGFTETSSSGGGSGFTETSSSGGGSGLTETSYSSSSTSSVEGSHNTSGGEGNTRIEKSFSSVVSNPYKTVENLAEVSSILDSKTVDGSTERRKVSKTSSEGNLFKEMKDKKSSRRDTSKSAETIYDMRRTGSVEDFMPDDIRKYMSIDPSNSKDSGFGEDLLQRFSEESTTSSLSSSSSASKPAGGMLVTRGSKTTTTKRYSRKGDKTVVTETKTVEGPDGKITTTVTETTDDGEKVVREIDGSEDLGLSNENGTDSKSSSSSTTTTYSSSSFSSKGGSDSNLSSTTMDQNLTSKSFSDTTMTAIGEGEELETKDIGNYGSLDRKTGKLKSIMKRSKSDAQKMSRKKGIRFAESVTGGTGSSSEEEEEEEENTSDSDSTTSFEEGSYDSQQGEVIYRCEDDEAIAQGLPGAQMFDQNIRETYELADEVRDACSVLATYLMDSTTIQTKQLNASQAAVQQEWFQVSSHKLSSPHQVEDFLSSVNEISKRLLEYIINMTDANGNTAIHYCLSHCNFEIANLLLDSEVCNINKPNKAGYTPIMLAGLASVQNMEQREIVRRLFSMGDINARAASTEQTALMLAASHGKTEMVKLLVEEGADYNMQDVDGSTALMCACEHGHLEIVNFLLAQPDIDANITDNENSTALTIAMETGHKDVGVVLYKHLNFSKPSSPGYHKKKRSTSSPTPSTFAIR